MQLYVESQQFLVRLKYIHIQLNRTLFAKFLHLLFMHIDEFLTEIFLEYSQSCNHILYYIAEVADYKSFLN